MGENVADDENKPEMNAAPNVGSIDRAEYNKESKEKRIKRSKNIDLEDIFHEDEGMDGCRKIGR